MFTSRGPDSSEPGSYREASRRPWLIAFGLTVLGLLAAAPHPVTGAGTWVVRRSMANRWAPVTGSSVKPTRR